MDRDSVRLAIRSRSRIKQPGLSNNLTFDSFSNSKLEEHAQLLGWEREFDTSSHRCPPPLSLPASRRHQVPPSADSSESLYAAKLRRGRDPASCCCGVALPWLRNSTSRIPLPAQQTKPRVGAAPPGKAMNTRGIFSRTISGDSPDSASQTQRAVYREPVPWTHKQKGSPGVVRRCFSADHSEDEDEDDEEPAPLLGPGPGRSLSTDQDGVKRMVEELPPLPPSPLRRRVLVRPKPDIPPYFRLCSPGNEPAPSSADLLSMDRFNKFRLGGRGGSAEGGSVKKKAPRTSDKTERLRELTERLKGSSVSPDRRGKPPAPPPPGNAAPVSMPTASECKVLPVPGPIGATAEPPVDTSTPKEDDIFDCINLRLPKPESRSIVGSYIQRTIPFRSASFSQVDYSPVDGKYIRNCAPRGPFSSLSNNTASEFACGSLTLPRKKAALSPASSASSTTVLAEPVGSTPSVDSAVGSDEGYAPSELQHHKPSGSRSMTHPLPTRKGLSDDMPFSSIDGNGLRSLQCVPAVTVQLQEVTEESDASQTDGIALISETESLCSVVGMRHHLNASPTVLESVTDSNSSLSDQEIASRTKSDYDQCSDIKLRDNPVSYEVFVRQFPNYKEYEKWMNESVLVNHDSDNPQEWTSSTDLKDFQRTSEKVSNSIQDFKSEEILDKVETEHDDKCINNFDPSNCPKCLEQMETGPSILQRLKASFHMEDLELEPHEKELYNKPSDFLLSKWTAKEKVQKHSFERSKSEPKETLKDSGAFQRTKSTDEPPKISTENPIFVSESTDSKERWPQEGMSNEEEPASPGEADASSQGPEWTNPTPQKKMGRWLERPKLVCQSSDERDDDPGSNLRPQKRFHLVARSDSLSEGESDQGERRPSTPSRASPSLFSPLDLSDSETRTGSSGGHLSTRGPHSTRPYSKRPLRGPYGQMLEAEMNKPEANRKLTQYSDDLKFLEEYSVPVPRAKGSSQSLVVTSTTPQPSSELTRSVSSGESRLPLAPRSRGVSAHSMDDSQLRGVYGPSLSPNHGHGKSSQKRKVSAEVSFSTSPTPSNAPTVCHQRTTSSPSQLEGISLKADEVFRRSIPKSPEAETALKKHPKGAKNSAPENAAGNCKDTRTHVVVELYETERSYVESLDFLVKEYMQSLKRPENAGLVDSELVDEIFYQVPAILSHHKVFLGELQKRLEHWDFQQKVGDVFLEAFTKQPVIETYKAFINNWKTAKEAIKTTCQAKPAFAKYLEAMAREHKGKLALDSLLIMPVQRIPRYELLIQTLLKHTDSSHADHDLLLKAQREVHELAVQINCTKRESLWAEQQQQVLRELEALVEGCDLLAQGRSFLRHDMVSLSSGSGQGQGQGARKERVLFLFSDLLVIARVKKRGANLRKQSGTSSTPSAVPTGLEANKYRCIIKATLDDLEIVKSRDENLGRMLHEMEQLSEDVSTLTQVTELAASLHGPHQQLEDLARELLSATSRQLADRQNSDSQLSCLELTLNTSNGVENISVIFSKPDKRASWEESFNEAKTRLALSADRKASPKFMTSVPIRKTRAGLQFTCAAPTLAGPGQAAAPKDVWVCNSDGYVGQVCVLSLHKEPNVVSCNGVCNARILCVAAIPAGVSGNQSTTSTNQAQLASGETAISISVEDADKSGRNNQLDSSSSSDEDDENDQVHTTDNQDPNRSISKESHGITTTSAPPASPSLVSSGVSNSGTTEQTSTATPAAEGRDEALAQPTMWLGTEDGCVHVYSCNDNIRTKRNKVKLEHEAAVHCIMYLDNRVFVSLANGDITVYTRDQGGWNSIPPRKATVGSAAYPVTRMVPVAGKLWCSCQHTIKILNTSTLQVEQCLTIADTNRAVTCVVVSGLAVWISLQNSAVLKLFHALTCEHLGDVNVAPAVTKMLASCDDIIRQHKAACLRVTSLLACKDLLWIGTSAGVVLTMPLPHVTSTANRLTSTPNVSGVPHGHTGHVRFLTAVEMPAGSEVKHSQHQSQSQHFIKGNPENASATNSKLLVISGGDGYEDFRSSSVSEVAGKEDSTNHLLLWQV